MNSEYRHVQLVVDLVQDDKLDYAKAKVELAKLGWVLHDTYPNVAQHVSCKQCAGCIHWLNPGFHMGMVTGNCNVKFDSTEEEMSCVNWSSALPEYTVKEKDND